MKRIIFLGFLLFVLLSESGQETFAQCVMNCTFRGTTTIEDLVITKKPWIDVRSLGAKGDGVADDTIAIQNAINLGSADGPYGHSIVFLPQGAYKITSRLKVGPNVTLQGEGVGFGSQIKPVSTDAISLLGPDFPKNNGSTFQNRIIGVTINMVAAQKFKAIHVHSAYTVKIEDVSIIDAGSGNGITISKTNNLVLQNVRVYSAVQGVGTGIVINDSEVKIYNMDVEGFSNGMEVNHSTGTVHIFGGYLERNGGYGILYRDSSFNSAEGVDIYAANKQAIAVGFWGSTASPSRQNSLIGCTLNALGGTVVFQDENSKDNTIINSYLNGSIAAKGNNNITVLNESAQVGKIQIGGGNSIAKHLSQTAALKFPAPHKVPGHIDLMITVSGADFGDTVTVGSPVAVGGNYILTAFVSAPDKVTIRWTQISGSPAPPDGAGGIYRADVWKHD